MAVHGEDGQQAGDVLPVLWSVFSVFKWHGLGRRTKCDRDISVRDLRMCVTSVRTFKKDM